MLQGGTFIEAVLRQRVAEQDELGACHGTAGASFNGGPAADQSM